MKQKTIATVFVALITMSLIAVSGSVVAQSGSTYYVGTSNTNDAVTYDTIQKAVDNASEGSTIVVEPGTYNTSVMVETANLTFESNNSSTVTINAVNEPYGEAFYGLESNNVSLGSNVDKSENAAYVNASSYSGNGTTYANLTEAFDNVSNNTVLYLGNGTYEGSWNVSNENISIRNYEPSGDVTINSTNTTEGSAFTGEFAENVRIGPDVTIIGDVYAGGGGLSGSGFSMEFYGIPVWAIAVVLSLFGYAVIEME
jgi:pectin methylesterase-like acyl-CoA thioesterase